MRRCFVLVSLSSLCSTRAQENADAMHISADDFKDMTGMDADEFMTSHNENAGKEGNGDELAQEEEEEGDEGGEATSTFSKEQLQALHRKMDEDGDGKLSPDELYDFANATRFAMAFSEIFIERIINELDNDGDGLVDIKTESPEEQGVFDHLKVAAADQDGDGKLSPDELVHIYVPDGDKIVLDKVVEGIFKQLDSNKDRKIEFEEFKKELGSQFMAAGGGSSDDPEGDHAQMAFEDLDQNKDGKLSKKELIPFASGTLEHDLAMEQIIDAADDDKDGDISLQELHDAADEIADTDAASTLADWIRHYEF